VWDSLSTGDRLLVEAVCAAENAIGMAEFNARNGEALDALINQHGVQLRRFSDRLLNEIGKNCGEVITEVGHSDATTKAVYKSFLKSRKESIGWSRLGDQAYGEARLLPFKYG
jgi:TRAP-type mannitol/chloroaromatic compound transport system substrate-binding protein